MRLTGTPSNPKTVAITSSPASFGATSHPYITITSTVNAFYTVDGKTPSADGSLCHFIGAGAAVDMYVEVGCVVKMIAAGADTGNAYMTEWSGLEVM